MKPDTAPPVTETSEAMKLVEGSLRVKVRLAVSAAIKLDFVAATAIVGLRVSACMLLMDSPPPQAVSRAEKIKIRLARDILQHYTI